MFVIVDDTLLVDSMGNIAFSYGYRHTSDSGFNLQFLLSLQFRFFITHLTYI